MSLYIYAITQADGLDIDIPKGIAEQPVYRIAPGSLGAFVSDYPAIHGDQQVANLAVLVPRAKVQAFEAAVHAAAETFDDDLAFSLNGPWPPHNFVQLTLDT